MKKIITSINPKSKGKKEERGSIEKYVINISPSILVIITDVNKLTFPI